jgi:hypothetical protein
MLCLSQVSSTAGRCFRPLEIRTAGVISLPYAVLPVHAVPSAPACVPGPPRRQEAPVALTPYRSACPQGSPYLSLECVCLWRLIAPHHIAYLVWAPSFELGVRQLYLESAQLRQAFGGPTG